MGSRLAKQIETWFTEHDEQGEFVQHERAATYSLIGPPNDAARVLFTTKPAAISLAFERPQVSNRMGMIGGYGLPRAADLAWIAPLIGPRQAGFLGDMDPVDLMIFAWLREGLRPQPLVWLGVNDVLLHELAIASPAALSFPAAQSEQASLGLLKKVLPDVHDLLGPESARLLAAGGKIELEGVVSALASPKDLLLPLIDRTDWR